MTAPETTPTPDVPYEPTQEELKSIYGDLFEAIKSPNPRHTVDTTPNVYGTAVLHQVILSPMESREVTRDPTTGFLRATAKDIQATPGADDGSSISIVTGAGESDSPQSATWYNLERVLSYLIPPREDRYDIFKTLPSTEDDEFQEEPDDDDYDEDLLVMMDEIEGEATRITPEDMAMLGRLTTILTSGA